MEIDSSPKLPRPRWTSTPEEEEVQAIVDFQQMGSIAEAKG